MIAITLTFLACGGGAAEIPSEMRGAYHMVDSLGNLSRELSITATSISGNDVQMMEKGSITPTSSKQSGSNDYIVTKGKYSGEACFNSDGCYCTGSINLSGDTIVVSLTDIEGSTGCAEILSGSYRKGAPPKVEVKKAEPKKEEPKIMKVRRQGNDPAAIPPGTAN